MRPEYQFADRYLPIGKIGKRLCVLSASVVNGVLNN